MPKWLVLGASGRLLLPPPLAASETHHALEQHRATHRHSREPAQRSDALRPRN